MNQATPSLAFVVFEDYGSTSQAGFQPIILVISLSLVSLSLGWQIGNLCMWPTRILFGSYTMLFKFWIICQCLNVRGIYQRNLNWPKSPNSQILQKKQMSHFINVGARVRSWLVPADGTWVLHSLQNVTSLTFTLIPVLLHPICSPLSPLGFLVCDPGCSRIFYSKQMHLIHSLFLKYIVKFSTSMHLFTLYPSPKCSLMNLTPK